MAKALLGKPAVAPRGINALQHKRGGQPAG